MTLRELIIDWLTESRYIRALERQHAEYRQDMTERLAEKDARIKELRTELAGLKMECDRMRLAMLPLGSPVGKMYAAAVQPQLRPPLTPKFDGPLDWTAELAAVLKQEEEQDGISSERRASVHQPAADDAA